MEEAGIPEQAALAASFSICTGLRRPLQGPVPSAPPKGETSRGVEATAESGDWFMRREIRPFPAPRAACKGGTPARPYF